MGTLGCIDEEVAEICGGATKPLWKSQEVLDELVITERDSPLGRDVFLKSLEITQGLLTRYEQVRSEDLSDVKAKLLEAEVKIRSTFAMDENLRGEVQDDLSKARDRLRVWICTEFGDCLISGQRLVESGFRPEQAREFAAQGGS